MRASATAPREACRAGRARRDGAGVGDVVDVEQRRQASRDGEPVGEQPLELLGARVGLRSSARPSAARGRGRRAGRSPSSRRPARCRGPRRRPARRAASHGSASSAGVICGVSMPTRNAGSPTSAKAAARRSSRPSPRWAITSKPSGSQAPGSPSRTHDAPARRASRRRRRACPRARPRRAARPAPACTADRAGSSRARRRAPWRCTAQALQRVIGHRAPRDMSRTARTVPRTVPVTFERPTRGAGSGPATSSIAQPAAAARSTISSGQPKRRSSMPRPSSSSRRAARIGPRSRSGTPARRRSCRASTPLASRACAARRRVRWRRRRARGRPSPPTTGPATRGSSPGSSDRVAVHEADDVVRWRARARRSRRRRTRAGLLDHPGAEPRGRCRPSRRSSRCRRRSAR